VITLITGVPGAGKTALLVSMLLDEFKGRRLVVDGIPELTVPHEPAPPVSEWTHYVPDESSQDGRKLSFTFEPNTLIVIDEAQRIFRVRASSAKVPPEVAAFETHRHLGLDFVLLCQHAGLIDPNIRKLVGRHIAIRATVLGRKLYEWSEVGDVESKTSRDIAARRSYKLPKKVFSLYKSAEVHTKIKRRVPTYVIVIAVCVLIFAGLTYRFYWTVSAKMGGKDGNVLTANSPIGGGAAVGARPLAVDYWAQGRERVEGLPHTAPQYDDLTKPKSVPFPAACASTATRCSCYTEQVTRIETMPDAMCRKIVLQGLYQAYADVRANGGMVAGQPGRKVDVPAQVAAVDGLPAGRDVPMVASIDSSDGPRSGSHIRAGGVTGASQSLAKGSPPVAAPVVAAGR
jgi:zona occludens toxin